jgi:uncharacterized membrane protein
MDLPRSGSTLRPAGPGAWLDGDAPLARSRFILLCGALGLVALLLRLPTLSGRSLWLDETYSAWFSSLPLQDLWTQVPLYETHPPFYYTLLKAWSALFGRGEAALRSLCVLASVLTVVLIPVCARVARLGARAERVALLAALLLSVNANNIVFAQQARPYAIHALGGMLAVFFACMLVLALARPPGAADDTAKRLWTWVAGLAVCASLTLWLHNTGVFAAFGIWTGITAGLLLATPGPRGRQALAVGLAGLGALLLWSPFVPMLLRQSAAMDQLSYWIRFSPRTITSAWTVMSGAQVMHYPMLALVLLGFGWLWKRARAHFWLLACTMALPVLAIAAYSLLVKPVFLARLFEWLAPLTMVLAALGIAVLRPAWRLPALAFVLALSAWSVLSFYRSSTEDWRGMLAGLQHDARPGDLVLAFPNEVQMPVAYYMKAGPAVTYLPAPFPARGLARRYTSNAGAPNIAPEDIPRLRALLWGRQRVWLIERRADLYDPTGLVVKELGSHFRLARKVEGNGANISLYEASGP